MQKEVTRVITRTRSKPRAAHIRGALFLGALTLSVTLAGCARDRTDKDNKQATAATATEDFPGVLATVGDEQITMADIRARSGVELDRIDTQARLVKSRIVEAVLDSMLDERVIGAEATRQGKTVDELVVAEAGVGLNPTDADIAAWDKSNPEQPCPCHETDIGDVPRRGRFA